MSAVTVINPAAIAVGPPQEITADITKFDFAKQQVGLMVATLMPLYTITTDEGLDEAMKVLKQAKEIDKAIEEKRKVLVKPFNDGCDKINTYKKTLVAELSVGIEKVKTAVLTYQKEREEKAIKARTAGRQDQLVMLGFTFNANRYDLPEVGGCSMMEIQSYDDKNWNTIIESFITSIGRLRERQLQQLSTNQDLTEAFGSEDDKQELEQKVAAVATPVARPVTTFVSAPSKVKGQTKTWTFEVTNANAVPREYLMVDTVLIREAMRNGVRDIPGVRFFQEDGLSIR
jgi:hypothetical protein